MVPWDIPMGRPRRRHTAGSVHPSPSRVAVPAPCGRSGRSGRSVSGTKRSRKSVTFGMSRGRPWKCPIVLLGNPYEINHINDDKWIYHPHKERVDPAMSRDNSVPSSQ
jgi:hypothetical protein